MGNFVIREMRGGVAECVHPVSVAVVDATGRLVASSGDPGLVTFMRSAAKPFQLLELVESGGADALAVTDRELAISCASHNSEVSQVAIVRDYLARIGFLESDLACGPHRSLLRDLGAGQPGESDPPVADPSRLASNCSGKHTSMLALCRHRGWNHSGYHTEQHRVQERSRDAVAAWSGAAAHEIAHAVDGCGVLTFALPLSAMALAYARLGVDSGAMGRIRDVMIGHAYLIAGARRLCTAVMQRFPGKVVAKVGAGGVYLAALPEGGLGVAIKVESGQPRAVEIALLDTLATLGLDARAELDPFYRPELLNTRGEVVGGFVASGSI